MQSDQFYSKVSGIWRWGVLIILLACKQQPVSIQHGAYILGPTNEMIPLSKQKGENIAPSALDAAVLVVTKRAKGNNHKLCSGTVLAGKTLGGRHRILTNYHCFAKVDKETNLATDVLMDEACTETHVVFGFRDGQHEAAEVATCSKGSLKVLQGADLAVFEVDGTLPSGVAGLDFVSRDQKVVGRKAMVIHYPAVDEQFVEFSSLKTKLPLASLTIEECQVLGGFAKEEREVEPILKLGVKHSCDLIHGSSGSALIDPETLEIIGVNWGGVTLRTGSEVEQVNVATLAQVAEQFVYGNLTSVRDVEDQVIRSLNEEGTSSSMAKLSAEEASGQQDTKSLPLQQQASAGGSGCSVGSFVDKNSHLPVGVLMLLLLLPLAAVTTSRERS